MSSSGQSEVKAVRQRVELRDVTLRDGLQLVSEFLPTERKLAVLRGLVDCNFTEIELTSFVPPRVIPQFADAADVVHAADVPPSVCLSVLVPNLKGAKLALEAGVGKINFVLSASEAHNLANVQKTTDQSLADFQAIATEMRAHGRDIHLSAGIATSFGCTIQGPVAEERVVEIAAQLVEAGAQEILLADTVGYGNPVQVNRLAGRVADVVGDVPLVGHFHDTRGLGLANIVAALDAGIGKLDVALGGLGGCPFAPGASGNVNAEDCIFMLESMGHPTGIDLKHLADVRKQLELWLPQERFTGSISRAGLPKTFQAA
ncbi:MAG: hydroxymethylglutaryl-CoA lyase [Hyphomicrobiales bacterium]|nr:hydroxymethylglutaryl-CoA lyase [Hyphomicrobiales bacterium]